MTSALIGYTGFVGTTLCIQSTFEGLYNSKNIADIRNQTYDLIICAGAPAVKWKANQEPEADLANLNMLMSHLKHVKAEKFVLISTVDVYKAPLGVDESTLIDTDNLHPYGKHRYFLEEFVSQEFEKAKIVRLPGLFGAGLKKNFLFDLIHSGESAWTHAKSVFQFYNMARLWSDLQVVLNSSVTLMNFATEPVQAANVARYSFDLDYNFETTNPPVQYDMQTQHGTLFGKQGRYMMSAEEIYQDIRQFAAEERAKK